jgi:hypothetical protein
MWISSFRLRDKSGVVPWLAATAFLEPCTNRLLLVIWDPSRFPDR